MYFILSSFERILKFRLLIIELHTWNNDEIKMSCILFLVLLKEF